MRSRHRTSLLRLMGSALVIALVTLAGGSASFVGYRPALLQLTAAGVKRTTPAPDAPVDEAVAAVTALGSRLDRLHPAGTNWVASPLSIAYAFAMARAGARGDTAAELDRAFRFPSTGLHDAFNAITREVVTADVPPPRPPDGERRRDSARPAVVCVGNGIFTQHGAPVGQEFLQTLAAQYGAGVYPVDFTNADGARAINAWVRERTAGRIPRFFDGSVTASLVLANTLYLRADWASPFSRDPTVNRPFIQADGSRVTVPTMHQVGDLRYADGPGWQAVELPYAGSDLAMRVVLPDPGVSLDLLSPSMLTAVSAALHSETVDLSLPRWEFTAGLDLEDLLADVRVATVSGPGADYSGIAPGLSLSRAVHRAHIDVDEWGTEAAAATALGFIVSAPSPAPVTMRVDRPFAFAIVHTGTDLPLFVGRVADPSAHP